MTSLEELAAALEAYVMDNRDGDAMSLATYIDNLIKDRIAEALRDALRRNEQA